MTAKRAAFEKEKKAAYERISEAREPLCEGCGSSHYEHSHRFPVAFENYRYIGEDESIDLYCRECHTNYERGYLFLLNNGAEALEYLRKENEQFFFRKLYQMKDALAKHMKKKWLQVSQGTLKIPEWAMTALEETE